MGKANLITDAFNFIGRGFKHVDDVAKGAKSVAGLGKKIAWGVAGAGAIGTIGSLLDLYFNDREKFNELMDQVKGLLTFDNKEKDRTYITYDNQRNLTINPDAVFRLENNRYVLCKNQDEIDKANKEGNAIPYLTMKSADKETLERQIKENIEKNGGFNHLKDGMADKTRNKEILERLKNVKDEGIEAKNQPNEPIKITNPDYEKKMQLAVTLINNDAARGYIVSKLSENTLSVTLNQNDKNHLQGNIDNLIGSLVKKADDTENVLFPDALKDNKFYRKGIEQALDDLNSRYQILYEKYVDDLAKKPSKELSPADEQIKNLFSNIGTDEKNQRIAIISALSARERVTDIFGDKPISITEMKDLLEGDVQKLIKDPYVTATEFRDILDEIRDKNDDITDTGMARYETFDDKTNYRTIIEDFKSYGTIDDMLKSIEGGKVPEDPEQSHADDLMPSVSKTLLDLADNIYHPNREAFEKILEKEKGPDVPTNFDPSR